MSDTAVGMENVVFSYGRKKILDGFSLTVKKGERICLFGPSGCGKSTVLRLIAGLEKPDSGSVSVTGGKIRPVFQEDRLLPFLTARENAAMFAGGEDVMPLFDTLGLREAAEEYPAKLSGGMARRTAIVRALAGGGDLYLFDEPFNGLDTENVGKAAALIRKRTEGATLICVLHNPLDAERLGCRIVPVGADTALL